MSKKKINLRRLRRRAQSKSQLKQIRHDRNEAVKRRILANQPKLFECPSCEKTSVELRWVRPSLTGALPENSITASCKDCKGVWKEKYIDDVFDENTQKAVRHIRVLQGRPAESPAEGSKDEDREEG